MSGLQLVNELASLRIAMTSVESLSQWNATTEFDAWVEEQLAVANAMVGRAEWESRREAVRALLRVGGFKPSGRSKPAQEYLLRCLNEGTFPRINPAVDCLNVLSVQIGLPISMLDAKAFVEHVRLRIGRPGERYVFNSVGQELELEGLIVACGGDQADTPVGSPVKDSMKGKITSEVDSIVCLIYAPCEQFGQEELDGWAEQLRGFIQRFACCP